jgi:hypothetical protein
MPSSPSIGPSTNGGEGSTPDLAAPAALPAVLGRSLHPRLGEVLRRVQLAERTAVGQYRRPTFRLMRQVLGASVRLGVPIQQLAECLGSSRESVRNRAQIDGDFLTPDLIEQLTDLTPAELDRCSGGELTKLASPTVKEGRDTYRTTDVIRALLSTPTPDAPRDQPRPPRRSP